MKKLGIALGLILLLFIWQFVLIGRHIYTDQETKSNQAIKQVRKNFAIKKINSVAEFRGQESYEVVQAVLNSGEIVWIWVPEKGNQFPISTKVSDGYSQKQILSAFKAKIPYKKIISVRLGLVNQNSPAWEITYVDPSGSYIFSYYDYYSGQALSSPIALH